MEREDEDIMQRDDILYIGGMIAIVVLVALAVFLPGGPQTSQMTSPSSAISDSATGSSMGESGQALPTIPPAKGSAAAPVQPPAQ
jgi:hypothetical protein